MNAAGKFIEPLRKPTKSSKNFMKIMCEINILSGINGIHKQSRKFAKGIDDFLNETKS